MHCTTSSGGGGGGAALSFTGEALSLGISLGGEGLTGGLGGGEGGGGFGTATTCWTKTGTISVMVWVVGTWTYSVVYCGTMLKGDSWT